MRDAASDVEAEEDEIEAEKTGGVEAPTKVIDSEEILGNATNEIDVGVEVVVPSKMESCDIAVTSRCKTGAGEGSPDVGHFGIEEPEKSAEGGPSVEEEKIVEEPKVAVDCSLSEDDMIIVEALTFVSQQIGDVEAGSTKDHDSLEEVAAAMLNEEKVMEIEECDDNPDLLAMVPFVNPSCPLHQQSSHVGEAVTPLSEVPAPKILTSKESRNSVPCEWIDNMSIFFAATTFMFKEKCETESISIVIFSPMYTDKVICDCAKRKVNKRWCYALDWESKKLYVLDSLGHKCPRRKQIDKHIVQNLELLFSMLMGPNLKEPTSLKVIIEDLPQQPNLFDCGIMVLKYMEHWEANKKYNGQSMPT
ncbi:Ulp1 protease family [Vigna unguiculata]|uniref:Ulp1 protease family n=1 Tax=Vigna unguiculata TaxID=3917 RepID=A0A4D6MXJ1_VIGUN|nr:Ulp1 protease family [Vigna unguiculata]